MTLLQLQYFKEVHNSGSTLKASQQLNVSQSTVSASIKALESELNVSLFTRTPKGLTLNEAGHCLLNHADKILKEVDHTISDMNRYSKPYRPIQLGMTVYVCISHWPDLSIALKKDAPDLEFEVTNNTRTVLIDMLLKKELDAIIIPLDNVPDDRFYYLELTVSPQKMISMSTSHPLAKEPFLTYEQVIHLPLLGYKGDDGKTEALKKEYKALGTELHYKQRCDQMATLLHLLRRNYGVAYLGESITKDYPDLISIPVKDDKRHILYLIWPKSNVPYGISKKTLTIFKKFFA